jgi:ATP-dependent helicase HrpB
LDADLTPLVLELALWGVGDPSELSWLTPPPVGAVTQARELLTRLGGLDSTGSITPHGRAMAELPLHPRLAHMVLRAQAMRMTTLACNVAALLSERDILRNPPGRRNADIRIRLDALYGQQDRADGATIDRGAFQLVQRTADLWRRQFARAATAERSHSKGQLDQVGLLLALAYPDRIAQRQDGSEARYLMANGQGASFAGPDPLDAENYLVIAELDGGQQWARIDLAAPVSETDVAHLYEKNILETEAVIWDDKTQSVRATRQRRLGSLVLSQQTISKPDLSLIATALLQGVRQAGLSALCWTPELQQLRARVRLLRRTDASESCWPDLSDDALLQTIDQWLGPYLDGLTSLDRVKRMDLATPLRALLTREQQQTLDRLAPTHITAPSGSHIRLDYETSEVPVLAVRLQEMFGCQNTPRVAGGKIPVMLHLLSPAQRPVQVTQDLAGFWRNTYHDVRRELRGRYPKHHWPDDPLSAPPTAKTKRRMS